MIVMSLKWKHFKDIYICISQVHPYISYFAKALTPNAQFTGVDGRNQVSRTLSSLFRFLFSNGRTSPVPFLFL